MLTTYVKCRTRQLQEVVLVVDAILMLMAGVRQTRNTAMVISVGNGNMLGNINADDVRQMRNGN